MDDAVGDQVTDTFTLRVVHIGHVGHQCVRRISGRVFIVRVQRVMNDRDLSTVFRAGGNFANDGPDIQPCEFRRGAILDAGCVPDLSDLFVQRATENFQPVARRSVTLSRPGNETSAKNDSVAFDVLIDMPSTNIAKNTILPGYRIVFHDTVSLHRSWASI